MIPSQMLRSTLEGHILEIISRQETYDCEISQRLQQYGFADISERTVYPLLLRLERSGPITAGCQESPLGPWRKYFSLSTTGRAELNGSHTSWKELEQAANDLFIHGGDNDEPKG